MYQLLLIALKDRDEMSKKNFKYKKQFLYIIFSLIFLGFSIYSLLPYGIIKERLITTIQISLTDVAPDFKFDIAELSSYWFTGIEFRNVKIQDQKKPEIRFNLDKVTFRVSILPLIFGEIKLTSTIRIDKGDVIAVIIYKLFDGNNNKPVLHSAQLDIADVNVENLLNVILDFVKTKLDVNSSMMMPIIEGTTIGGFLSGTYDYKNEKHYNSKLFLKFKNAFVHIRNESLNIPKQTFSDALISLEFEDGNINIKKETELKAENIALALSGTLKTDLENIKRKEIALRLNLFMSGNVEKNFGFLIPQLLKCPGGIMQGGTMNAKLFGFTSGGLNCTF
jgi:type II secretion system protein N